ncbi:MAG: S66 peptidase family protein [Nanoarchaeota archaeon]|nr:S66 peptidase family protein [Nanoarchaeota archaeon]
MGLIIPKKLEKGDTIGIIAPSGGFASRVPHRLDAAMRYLESEGYVVKKFPLTAKNNGWESAPAEERAKEIMDAFLDKTIKAIICTIGGSVINKTLKFLDFNKIKKNPKILCGYSDITVLHYALLKKCNLSTFYGPCAITQFGEYPRPLNYTIDYFNRAVKEKNIGRVLPSKEWTDELLDWNKKLDLERPRKMKKNNGFEWLRKGSAEGNIVGGCLPSICHLLGTSYLPDHKDKILFIELPEGVEFGTGIVLSKVDAFLCDLELSGIFSQIKGLVFGRPFLYSKEKVNKLKQMILYHTKDYDFPILYGADIGHSDPQITVPLGTNVKLDSKNNLFEFL